MRQLCRDRRGRTRLVEIPPPTPRREERLVRVSHALLAPWSEIPTQVKWESPARKLETVRELAGYVTHAGLSNALAFLRTARGDLQPGGFSASGYLADDGRGPAVPVLCAGAGLGAHAEYLVAGPDQLVPLPFGATTRAGALAGLGAAALVALGRLRLAPGKRLAVFGLGVWGRMAVLLASHLGYEVVAVDPEAERLQWARAHGAKETVSPTTLSGSLWRDGRSVSGILLAAGSLVPPSAAGARVVPLDGGLLPVGDELRRSLREFADHLAQGWEPDQALGMPIVRFEEAARAREPALLEIGQPPERHARLVLRGGGCDPGRIGVGLAGCGTFAKLHHLPNLARDAAFELVGIASRNGSNALVVARRFGAAYCTTDSTELMRDPDILLLFLTGRHDEHVPLLLEAAERRKRTFVEKPVAIDEEGCALLERRAGRMWVTVGFNRRFAPLAEEAKARLSGRRGPAFLNYRVNFGAPVANWFRDPARGGGRLIAAACHYVDLATWFLETRPVRVFAELVGRAAPGTPEEQDSVVALVRYADGSVFSLSFSSLGRREAGPKEELEVHWDGSVLRLTDFHSLVVNGQIRRLLRRDLGERRQLAAIAQALQTDGPPPVPLSHGIAATRLTLRMIEAIRAGGVVPVRDHET